MVMGDIPEDSEKTSYSDSLLTVGPPLVLLLLVFLLGVWIPQPVMNLLTEGAALLEVPK
jgi:hydrogenase-4 component F